MTNEQKLIATKVGLIHRFWAFQENIRSANPEIYRVVLSVLDKISSDTSDLTDNF